MGVVSGEIGTARDAHDVSYDGSIVVGVMNKHIGDFQTGKSEAFLWQNGVSIGLGFLPGHDNSIANAISDDGTIVAGRSWNDKSSNREAFVWDSINGMRNLKDLVPNDSGWILLHPRGISSNGVTIVGKGTNPNGFTEAWLAVLRDQDGISDEEDNCPLINNPDQFDNDNDGLGNACDGCPNDPNKIHPHVCGCGQQELDSDSDGTPDCVDDCPIDPNKVSLGDCGCGVPENDDDLDGTSNCIDGCPNDPDKVEPGICGCGVSDDDRDGDGLVDCLDACPDDPSKTEPGVCGCNNPDVDTDTDGLLDCLDNCPNHFNQDQADCDDNGLGDVCAISNGSSFDCNANELPDECDIAAIHNCCETLHGLGCNNSEIESCVCVSDSYCCDREWDRLCVDRVTDLKCGTCEMVSDCDANSIPDECEPDCNTNGTTDACDISDTTSADCQQNSVPDECESDLDSDGLIDDCDSDIDGDGFANEVDVCNFTKPGSPIDSEGRSRGDINLNCILDLEDYEALFICLSFSGPEDTPPLPSCLDDFDVDGDNDVDMWDVASFQRFFGP